MMGSTVAPDNTVRAHSCPPEPPASSSTTTTAADASTNTTALTQVLWSTATADLYDQFLDTARVPDIAWRSFGGKTHFAGPVYTIKCFEDNSRIKEMAEQDGKGRVLVVDAGGSTRCAVLGDLMARMACDNHWNGIIIHGCVRDVSILANVDMGILALGSTPRKSTRRGEGQTELTIRLHQVEVNTGDYVVADADGVLFLRPDQVQTIYP